MSDDQQWYYTDSHGQQAGPISLPELKTLIAQSAVTSNSMAWTNGMDDWKPIGQLPSLRSTPAPNPTPTAVAAPTITPTVSPTENQVQPTANPYAPPSAYPTNEELENPYQNLEYPGIKRLGYFLRLVLLIFILFVVVAIGSSLGEPSLVIILISFIVFFVFYIRTCLLRIRNIGASGWWLLLMLVPIASSLLAIFLLSCPEGFAHHKKMDTAGIVVAVICGLLFFGSLALNVFTALG